MSGTVCVCADEAGRFSVFAASIQGLRIPDGAKTLWLFGNDFAGNRNVAAQSLLDGDGEWLWFVDDDHVFSPHLLEGLVAYLASDWADMGEKIDIVASLVLRRQQPFSPVARIDGRDLDLSLCGSTGLVEVESTGSSGMLIRREVLEAIDPPWFELRNGVSEDVTFCEKAREAGFDIYVDLGARMGHLTTCAIWPAWDGDRWLTGYTVADGFKLMTDVCVDALAES